jgi:arylsulfatase A-like enzyme
VIAVTADHGECFENGVFFEHADCLFDGAIQVPLLIRYPPLVPGGVRRSEQVDLLRLAPTLLELAGLRGMAGFARPSLLRDTGGQPALFESPLYFQGAVENRSLRAAQIQSIGGQAVRPSAPGVRQAGVRWQSWKYVAAGSHEELYDLRSDPGETRNLAAARPEAAARLRAELRSWVAAYPLRLTSVADVNAELQETLRALGYVH